MPDLTPTPPADTRQQAVERVHEALVDYVNEYGWPMRGDGIHLSRHLATALAWSQSARDWTTVRAALAASPAPTDNPKEHAVHTPARHATNLTPAATTAADRYYGTSNYGLTEAQQTERTVKIGAFAAGYEEGWLHAVVEARKALDAMYPQVTE